MSSSDQRKYPRLPVNLSATYRSASLTIKGQVSNLSQSGLSLRCSRTDPLGTQAVLELELPSSDSPIALPARVIWVSIDPDRGATMGVRFEEATQEALTVLSTFVLRSSQSRLGA